MLKLAVVALVLVPLSALVLSPAAGWTKPADTAAANKVISAVEADFNGDGSPDRAVLTDNGDTDADLVIYLNDGQRHYKTAATALAIAFNGGLAGNTPELRVTRAGALQVHAENMAIGRDHWERTLTVSYRRGQFVVSGVTASSSDTLDPDAGSACDINLLTGKGTSNGKAVTIKAGSIPLSQWTEDRIPAACQ